LGKNGGGAVGQPASDRAPAWSPNGRKIAFSRNGTGVTTNVYVIGSDGRGLRRIATRAYAPAWSPNGRMLAVGSERNHGEGIDLVNADGSARHPLLNEGFGGTWSPDGRQLAYVGATIDPDTGYTTGGFLAIVEADGTGKRVIFSSPEKGMPYQPTWSPDGRQIAFRREFFTGGPGEIWVVAPTGEGLSKLTGNGESPGWSPDSRELIYACFDSQESYRIYVMRRDGTRRTTVGSCGRHAVCGFGADPDWHR
jgi:TolB protein